MANNHTNNSTVCEIGFLLVDEANLATPVHELMGRVAVRWPTAPRTEIDQALANAIAQLREEGEARLDKADRFESYARSSRRRRG
jgi:hypothetical protein